MYKVKIEPNLSQVILKDLEVLAEIASSPAGQTDASGSCDNSDAKSELHIPGGVRDQMVVGAYQGLLITCRITCVCVIFA